jgi:hypothetical protein
MSRNPVPDPAEYPETPELRDLALLSAYLDGVLTAEERAALDQRLRTEPVLQANLDALRQMTAILRAAPVLTVPRDFVLDPAVYGRRSQLRMPRRPVRLLGGLGAVAAIAAVVILAFGITTANRQPTSQNTILVASNPTFAGSPDQQAAKTDQLFSTATLAGVLSDNSRQLQASLVPTLIRSATPIPVSPIPVALNTQPPPTIIATSAPPATASPAPAAAAQQSGSAASSGQAGASGGQDAIGSTQPNLSAPVAPGAPPSAANGGLGPVVAPSLLIAPTATLRQAAIAPTSAPTSAKVIPSARPPSAANQPAPVVVNLPTLLRIIWWLLIALFTGKGL